MGFSAYIRLSKGVGGAHPWPARWVRNGFRPKAAHDSIGDHTRLACSRRRLGDAPSWPSFKVQSSRFRVQGFFGAVLTFQPFNHLTPHPHAQTQIPATFRNRGYSRLIAPNRTSRDMKKIKNFFAGEHTRPAKL